MAEKKMSRLRSLVQLDIDAIATYDAALRRIDVPYLRDKLMEFRGDHQRHVLQLNELIVRNGGRRVEERPDLKGMALTGMTSATSMLGNEAALIAMVGNEELTTRSYESALKLNWTVEERQLIEKNCNDERRHLAFVKEAARRREWSKPEAERHV